MYSGILPKGFTESELSSDAEEDGQCEQGNKPDSGNVRGTAGQSGVTAVEEDSSQTPADPDILPGISQKMWQVCCSPCSVINYSLLAAH